MKPTRVKPISYVKANAADLIRELKGIGQRCVITHSGEETLALLKILALGRRQVEEDRTVPAEAAFRRLRGALSTNRVKSRE
jgi:hypothetical protein